MQVSSLKFAERNPVIPRRNHVSALIPIKPILPIEPIVRATQQKGI